MAKIRKGSLRVYTVRDIQSEVDKELFRVYHDMPDVWGLNIENADASWQFRTDKKTPESLIAYIRSKDASVHVLTEKEYLNL